jgi:hypothetical protein
MVTGVNIIAVIGLWLQVFSITLTALLTGSRFLWWICVAQSLV